MIKITTRQKKILKIIIEKYINNNFAISSLNLKNENLKNLSSATIRNDMVILESSGFISKSYKSAGRIPTKKGYKVYIDHLMKNLKNINFEIKDKLTILLDQRHNSIDATINKSVEIISNFLNLPVIVTHINNEKTETLKKLDIAQLDKENFLIYIITSTQNIYKNTIFIKDFEYHSDLFICIRLLNEKLIDCPLPKIKEKISELTDELRISIHKYEFIYSQVILKILNNIVKKLKPESKIYNTKAIISQPEFKNQKINIDDIFGLLENYSTFSQVEFNYLRPGKTFINLDCSIQGVSIATTNIKTKNKTHNLSIIGPTRMNYLLIKNILDFLNKKLLEKK